jgi:protein DGCR14
MGGGSGEGEVEGTPTHLPMAPRPEQDDDAMSTVSSKSRSSSKDPTENMTLNTFLAKYTSEDNQSFEEILENADKKHKIKVSCNDN